jgi:hypothetical protein
MHFLYFYNAADGWWQEEHPWVFGRCWVHVLCTTFSFSQAVGEELVNAGWRDSDFCSNCHVWNTACTFKDGFHLFHVAFICCWCWGFTVSSQSFLMAFPHQWTVSYEGSCVPELSFNDL